MKLLLLPIVCRKKNFNNKFHHSFRKQRNEKKNCRVSTHRLSIHETGSLTVAELIDF
jgi:hypothetical protein